MARRDSSRILQLDAQQNEQFLNELGALLRRRRLVPFVGAGMTAFAYPTLPLLIEQVCRDTDIEQTSAATFQDFLNHVKQRLPIDTFRRYIERTFRTSLIPHPTPDEPVYLLPKLRPELILTSNYDCVLEDAFVDSDLIIETSHTFDAFTYRFLQLAELDSDRPVLLKLHGTIGRQAGFVLTADEYHEAYQNPGKARRLLRRIFTSHSCLFLGTSLHSTDAPVQVLSELNDSLGAFSQIHYAVLPIPPTPDARTDEQNRLTRLNVNVIWYDGSDHKAALTEILSTLVAAVESSRSLRRALHGPLPTVSAPFFPLRYVIEHNLGPSSGRDSWADTAHRLREHDVLDDLVVERLPPDAGDTRGLLVRTTEGLLHPDGSPFVVTEAWGTRAVDYMLPSRFKHMGIRGFGLEIDACRSLVSLRLLDEGLLTVRIA